MRRLATLIILCIALFTVPSSCNTKNKKTTIVTEQKSILLVANDFESKLAATPDAQLVDVRTPEEFNEGHLKDAVNINYQGNSFMQEVDKLDKTRPTFVYCQSGGRSSESCNYMANHGFKTLYELKGGFGIWTAMNKPFDEIKSE